MTIHERLNNWSTLARLGLATDSPLTRESPIFLEIKAAISEKFESMGLPSAEISMLDVDLCTVKVPNGFGTFFWISLRFSKEYNEWAWWQDLEDDVMGTPLFEIESLVNQIAEAAKDRRDFERVRREITSSKQ